MTETNPILVLVLGTLLFTLFAVFTILYIALQKKKQYRYHIEQQEREHAYKQQLMRSKMEVQEQTLKALSAELHDNVAQVLGIAKMQVHVLAEGDKPALAADTAAMLGKAINEVRNMSHVLNGSFMLKSGLEDAIEKDMARIRATGMVQCGCTVSGETRAMDEGRELVIFRIIQESVNNAVKHASASAIDVALSYAPDQLKVDIRDDGKGFDTKAVAEGMGLQNIRERVHLLNGQMTLQSTVGHGTHLQLIIPVQNEQA